MSEPAQRWEIVILKPAARSIKRLPRDLLRRINAAIQELAVNPRPIGCVMLDRSENKYRVRVGDWRILYRIEDRKLIVTIVEVGPRGSVYRSR